MTHFFRLTIIAVLLGLAAYYVTPVSALERGHGFPGSVLRADEKTAEDATVEEDDEGETGNIDPDEADEDEGEAPPSGK